MRVGRPRLAVVLVAAVASAVSLTVARGETHQPIPSKYPYNDHVFPVTRHRCGRCPVAGGVARCR